MNQPSRSSIPLEQLLSVLESRVGRATETVRRLKAEVARLSSDLEAAQTQAREWQQRGLAWERERAALGDRLERLLKDLDTLNHAPEGTESSHELADRYG